MLSLLLVCWYIEFVSDLSDEQKTRSLIAPVRDLILNYSSESENSFGRAELQPVKIF